MLPEFLFFWLSLGLLFFCYAGYGILLFLFNALKGLLKQSKKVETANQPPVTLIVAAYNEEQVLLQKIMNTLQIDYPANLITVIIITDGSVDNSAAVVKQFPSITLLHQSERKGKLAALKRAMQFVKTDIVVFSDANTMLNKECISRITDHYVNDKVGGVAGEKKIARARHVSALGEAEGLYWKYESFLKKQDADFYTVVGAAGELFSIRTGLFEHIDDNIILDDFIISMKVCLAGYKIEYEPGAYAVEMPSASLREEAKRKIRISAGAYQSIGYLKSCLNVFKHPALSFQYISRRLLRWVICPPLLVILFVVNLMIVYRQPVPDFYGWFLILQIFFYLLALPGWLLIRSGRRAGILSVPFYFVFMNYCLARGFVRFIKGKYTVLWEKSLRQAVE
jgi:biofilm PGA synthesis N-glycosyltransferase PgaC